MLDGDPSGVKVIEKSNWSGVGLEIPRPLLNSVSSRAELAGPGVYVLIGPPETTDLPTVYVGEGNVVRSRILDHEKNKEFWTHVIVFASNAKRLNKAHVQFLEASLVALASEAKRCSLQNSTAPQVPPLSESDIAEVDGFLTNALQLLDVLGYRYFERPAIASTDQAEFVLNGKGVTAHGYETASGFVVRVGSNAVVEEVASLHPRIHDRRQALIAQEVITLDGAAYGFTMDYEFSSPSQAADVVLGRSANGRIEWKTAGGKTLAAVQDAQASNS